MTMTIFVHRDTETQSYFLTMTMTLYKFKRPSGCLKVLVIIYELTHYSLLKVFCIYSSESITSIEIASIKSLMLSENSVHTRTF